MTTYRVLPLLAVLLAGCWAANAGAAESAASSGSTPKKWHAGTNYKLVANPQAPVVASGKVEVMEVFWYGCGHCYALDPSLEEWNKDKPAYVEFVRVPVIWGPGHKQHAKLYYTIQALHRPELHARVFEAIHKDGAQLIARDEVVARTLQQEFLAREGVSEKDFNAAYDSMAVSVNLQRAEKLTRVLAVESVPLLFVNGKYVTSVSEAGGTPQLLALITDLAASEKNH